MRSRYPWHLGMNMMSQTNGVIWLNLLDWNKKKRFKFNYSSPYFDWNRRRVKKLLTDSLTQRNFNIDHDRITQFENSKNVSTKQFALTTPKSKLTFSKISFSMPFLLGWDWEDVIFWKIRIFHNVMKSCVENVRQLFECFILRWLTWTWIKPEFYIK